jgi:serine/threonine protein kinase
MSPEYATLGQLTPKADVYSFGILLLEIMSGRKNIDTTLESEKVYLVKWVCMLIEPNPNFLYINSSFRFEIYHFPIL